LRDERARLPSNPGPPIADAARAWTEIGNLIAAHADDVTACDHKYKLRRSAVAQAATKTKDWRQRRRHPPNCIPKTSVQTTASSKRQFSLILPSTSTSPMTHQFTLEHYFNKGGRSNKNPINGSWRIQHQFE
jgi:hypothetical protein